MAAGDAILELRNVVKTFPGVRALDGVSFELRAGEAHALVGENGAGKSTLINVLAGVLQPDAGELRLDGQPVRFADTHAASRAGIGVVFQELSLSPNLSVAENILANRQPASRLGLIDGAALRRDAAQWLQLFDLGVDPETPAGSLPAALQQVVEILKAVSLRPRILVLDEPTSSLSGVETRKLFALIRRLKAEGTAIIYISHHLAEVFELADRVTVLRDGQRVDTCDASSVDEQALVRMMVGRELGDLYGLPGGEPGEEVLRVEDGSRECAFAGVSLAVRAGEVVGMAGLAGAGRTELGRAIFGAEPFTSGRMTLGGAPLSPRSPATAIGAGIAYLTESRKEDGLFLDMSLAANCIAPSLSRYTKSGFMDDGAVAVYAEQCRAHYGVAASSVGQPVGSLSGGNQQKALLAMWMGVKPRLLIADEPTRGVDVGARSEIYRQLREQAASGVAILLISSDLPELLGMSDRILVMREGRIAGEFDRASATEERIVACAAGVAA